MSKKKSDKKVDKDTPKKETGLIEILSDNKSLVSLRMRRIADEYDALLMANDHLIRENLLLEKEVQILLKELDLDNSEGLRRIIRAKALLR